MTDLRALAFHIAPRTLETLRAFLPEYRAVDRTVSEGLSYDAVISLDGRDTARAGSLARRLGAQHLMVMDGLLRSVGPSAPTISRIVDRPDRAAPGQSIVTRLLNKGVDDVAVLEEARSLRRFRQAEGLSRVNGRPSLKEPLPSRHERVLVVDRSTDDGFLGQPLQPVATYKAMLRQAREDYPHALLVLQRDPGVRSAFDADDLALVDRTIDAPVDAAELIAAVDAVYTVGSLLGLEAVLTERPVTCFGAPFYAGWGLTRDLFPVSDRTGARSVDALFAAAYLLAPRYVDPLTGETCTPRVAFQRMAALRRHARRVAGRWVALNIPPPKQGVMRTFLAGPMSTYSPAPRRAVRRLDGVRFAAWTSRPNRAVRQALVKNPSAVTHLEDGFLRSIGLGSGFQPAASIVLDSRGAYYDPSRPSDLTELLGEMEFSPDQLEQAAVLRRQIVDLGLSKYNLGAADAPPVTPPNGSKVLLVTGQVENDQSLLTGGGGLTNLGLLERVRRDNPDAYVIYKEHPDVTAGHRPGRISGRQGARLADELIGPANITRLIEAADEVHTITSLSGFEALLREKRVVTYGRPFYAGWGLTSDQVDGLVRPRTLSLDALVAGVLMIYPLYLDPVTRLPCDALTFVSRLAMLRDTAPTPIPASLFGGVSRYIEAIRHTFRPIQPADY